MSKLLKTPKPTKDTAGVLPSQSNLIETTPLPEGGPSSRRAEPPVAEG